jgi:hypothetical protein
MGHYSMFQRSAQDRKALEYFGYPRLTVERSETFE